MTEQEIKAEWEVEYETRLGMMCEDKEPTCRQKHSAKIAADNHIAGLREAMKDEASLKRWMKKHGRRH